mgnify:CR=1 FL=1
MKDAVIVSQPDGFTEVYGMHGGVGLIQWKRMVVGEHLFGVSIGCEQSQDRDSDKNASELFH